MSNDQQHRFCTGLAVYSTSQGRTGGDGGITLYIEVEMIAQHDGFQVSSHVFNPMFFHSRYLNFLSNTFTPQIKGIYRDT